MLNKVYDTKLLHYLHSLLFNIQHLTFNIHIESVQQNDLPCRLRNNTHQNH